MSSLHIQDFISSTEIKSKKEREKIWVQTKDGQRESKTKKLDTLNHWKELIQLKKKKCSLAVGSMNFILKNLFFLFRNIAKF